MAESPSEKQPPTPRQEYEGLELDTRAGDGTDKHLDHSKPLPDLRKWQEDEENRRYLNEKQMIQAHEVPQASPTSPSSAGGVLSPQMSQHKTLNESMGSPPEPRTRRICGLRRGLFWLMFGVVLALVIVAAVVGGVVGGTRHSSSGGSDPAPSSDAPAAGVIPVDPGDVVAGSPLNAVSYSSNGTGSAASRQRFRLYYQSLLGNIKEAVFDGNAWGSAVPIFTDALNNTGLATTTYLNGSAQTGQIFYIGMNNYIQEKRVAYNTKDYWEPGTLNPNNIVAMGNLSLPDAKPDQNPPNEFDGYRMAAVYSENYSTGAGTRLFYHASSMNGTKWVQEWIWTRSTDNWRTGQAIQNVYPNSHLAATVDEENELLRLFFSSGNLTLQEVWLNISDPNGLYNNGRIDPPICTPFSPPSSRKLTKRQPKTGLPIPKFLPQNDADISATSKNGTTYLYHPSNIGELGVRELIVSGVPINPLSANNVNQESFNLSEALVTKPDLASMGGTSPYSPVAACIGAGDDNGGSGQQIHVFWADKVSGSDADKEGSVTGYRSLQQVTRSFGVNGTWAGAQGRSVSIQLGSSNSYPSNSSRRRRRWLTRLLRRWI
ncbi:MAG: hypothetical protein Q9220_004890 [cf. Caloplaca sp. 1 TL-2023]